MYILRVGNKNIARCHFKSRTDPFTVTGVFSSSTLYVHVLHNRQWFTRIITKRRFLTHFCAYLTVKALKYDFTCLLCSVSEGIHSNPHEELHVLCYAFKKHEYI